MGMRAVAITLENVLHKPLDVEALDRGATLLYASLAENFRVVVLGTENVERDNHFLLINGLNRHIKVEPMVPEDGPTDYDRKRGQLKRLRSEGFHFEFVVVPDPELATDLIMDGYTTLLYTHPTFSARAFRPDHVMGTRPWQDLVAEVEFQVTEKAKKMKDRV